MIYKIGFHRDGYTSYVMVEAKTMEGAIKAVEAEYPNHRVTSCHEDIGVVQLLTKHD